MSCQNRNIGFVQFNPELGNQDKNIQTISRLMDKIENIHLIVLPELANSGYNFRDKEEAYNLAEEIENSSFINFLTEKCSKNNCFIVSGINERDDEKLYNSSVLLGPNGLIGKYRKIHLFWNEFDIFEKGNLDLKVYDTGFVKVGMLICFDWVFPEVWRILALKGAELICHPSNLVLPYAQQAVPVHGMINRTFIITANRYGKERGVEFSGQSFISDPEGRTLYTAPKQKDAVFTATIDPAKARDKKITPRNHVIDDRQPDSYSGLV